MLSKPFRHDLKQAWKAVRSIVLLLIPLSLLLILNSSSSWSSHRQQSMNDGNEQSVLQVKSTSSSGNLTTLTSATVVALSDTHGLYHQPTLQVPHGDLLVCAGDIELRNLRDWQYFLAFLEKQPHAHKVVAFGNMDSWTESVDLQASEWVSARQRNVSVLRDSAETVGGMRVLASPWTPKFYGSYQLMDERHAEAHWSKVLPPHLQVDILITHGPPYGYGDLTRNRHVGDKALLKAAQALITPPRLWVCGHIHDGRGVYHVPHSKGDILLVNAAVAHLAQGRHDIQPFVINLASDKANTLVTVGAVPPRHNTTSTLLPPRITPLQTKLP